MQSGVNMAKLTTSKRNALSDKSFAIPSKRSYPINDISHARSALSRVAQFGSPSEKKQVCAAVCKKYPSINSCKR